jgi:hypothetical protein
VVSKDAVPFHGGTSGSNPSCSTGESASEVNPGVIFAPLAECEAAASRGERQRSPAPGVRRFDYIVQAVKRAHPIPEAGPLAQPKSLEQHPLRRDQPKRSNDIRTPQTGIAGAQTNLVNAARRRPNCPVHPCSFNDSPVLGRDSNAKIRSSLPRPPTRNLQRRRKTCVYGRTLRLRNPQTPLQLPPAVEPPQVGEGCARYRVSPPSPRLSPKDALSGDYGKIRGSPILDDTRQNIREVVNSSIL